MVVRANVRSGRMQYRCTVVHGGVVLRVLRHARACDRDRLVNGVGRIGAIAGPVLGGLLLGAGISSPVLFCIAGAASVGAAIAVFALKRFVLDRHPSAPVEPSTAPAAGDLLRRT